MADSRRAFMLAAVTCLCSCYGVGNKTELFMRSSLDLNLGKPHQVRLGSSDLQLIADRVIDLAKQRELALVRQHGCHRNGRSCQLAFRGKPVDRRVFRGTQSHTMSYYSRYFVTLRPRSTKARSTKIQLSAIGVPVLGGEMSCPPRLQTQVGCKAPSLARPYKTTLTAAVKREWGYDISGANEAETLQGLLVELKRSVSRPLGVLRVAPAKSTPPSPQAPTATDRKAYEQLRSQGKACYRQRDYRCALERFSSALERVRDPAMRFNLASAQDKLGLAALAVRNYRRYLKEAAGSVPGQALSHITKRMESLLRRVGQVRLKVTPIDATLLVNGTAQLGLPVTRVGAATAWDLVLDPGSYQIELRHPAHRSRSLTVTVMAGEERKLSLTLAPR